MLTLNYGMRFFSFIILINSPDVDLPYSADPIRRCFPFILAQVFFMDIAVKVDGIDG
jgi:hypothetical protein